MAKYKKCPRCDVNYILDGSDYCPVCQLEMKGQRVLIEDLEEEGAVLCAKCGLNFAVEGEKFCEDCLSEALRGKDIVALTEPEPDDTWTPEAEDIVEDLEDEVIPDPEILQELSLEGMKEEETLEEEATEESADEEDEDFEFPTAGEEDEDLDDDDEEDEEEEDDDE